MNAGLARFRWEARLASPAPCLEPILAWNGAPGSLALQLAGARERIRGMMRQHARVVSQQEQAIELMLAMLAKKGHRISDHPEWVLELGRLSGAET